MRILLSILLSCVLISTASSQYSRGTSTSAQLLVKTSAPAEAGVPFPVKSSFISLNKAAFTRFATNSDVIEQIEHFPMPDGSEVTLSVQQFDVLTKTATVVAGTKAGDIPQQVVPHVLLSGTIEGVDDSRVMLAVFEDYTTGFIEQDGKDRIIISPAKENSDGIPVPMVVYYQSDIAAEFKTTSLSCNTDEWLPNAPALSKAADKIARASNTQMPQATTVRLIKIAVDCDFEYYKDHGSNMTKAQSYAIAVMGAMSEIYQRDLKVAVKAEYLRIWNAEDPYTGTTTEELLPEFQSYWNDNMGLVTRADALLFSGHDGIGGLAFLDVLCDQFDLGNNYAACGLNNNIIYPSDKYVWDSDVTSHEFGHNCGSVHTHNCLWNPAIDSCYPAEGDCFSATKARKGTIMSYCHLTPSGTDLKFHTKVINYLKANIQNAGCTQMVQAPEVTVSGAAFACPGTPVPLSASLSAGTPPYEVLWFPKTGLDTTTVKNVKASPLKTTTYICRVTDANNVRAFDTVVVTVDTVKANAGTNVTACQVESIPLKATGSGRGTLQFVWRNKATNAIVGNTASITVPGTLTATYTVTVTDSIGCSISDDVLVTINMPPTTTITPASGKPILCEGGSLSLDAGVGFLSYLWSTGATTRTITITTAGTYSCAVSKSGQFCNDTAVIEIMALPALAKPIVSFDNGILSSTQASTYQWYLGGIKINAATSQTYNPKSGGTYKVEITDSNGCKSVSDNMPITLGVNEMTDIVKQVSLYPNPANKIVTIFAGEFSSELRDLSITDISGKTIWHSDRMNSEELKVDISNWPSGSYILHFLAQGEGGAVKFAKE